VSADQSVVPHALSDLSAWAGHATTIATGLAGLSYAFGWILTARFYGSFGIDPESAGVTFSWLAIRAFLIGLAGLALILLARAAPRFASSIPGRSQSFEGPGLNTLILVGCVVAAVAVSLPAQMLPGKRTSLAEVGIALIGGLLLGGAIIAVVRPRQVQVSPSFERLSSGVQGFLIGFTAVGVLLLPYKWGTELANDVRAGRPVQISIVPGLPAFYAPRVHLSLVDAGQPTPDVGPYLATCVVRLGGANGVSLYYGNGRVLRVADEVVYATGPC
jgi:hypothetical protein